MIDEREKSTGDPGAEEVAPGLFLDPRLALIHRDEGWLAVADLHFGFELSRRRDGGLWPLWGMESIEYRLQTLIDHWQPERVILAGDIVDGLAGPDEACRWLDGLDSLASELVLIAGNHDRGAIRRDRPFVSCFETEKFFFHHGHLSLSAGRESGKAEVHGHLHPSVRLDDGAGTSLRLPTLVRECRRNGAGERWVLPAFSPWAGGSPFPSPPESAVTQWACGAGRVVRVENR